MRIPPNLTVNFVDNEIQVEKIGKHTRAYLGFRIFKWGNLEKTKKMYIKTEQPIKSLMLESDL